MTETSPPVERRHSRRIAIEGVGLTVDERHHDVMDLSLGGVRISTGETDLVPGDTFTGELTVSEGEPLTLSVRVAWVNPEEKAAGLEFKVVGQNLVDRILGLMLDRR